MGVTLLVCEPRAERRAELGALGIRAVGPAGKLALLAEPVDAVAVNAAGGSLDAAMIAACAANPRLQVICGSENLAMPDPSGAETLWRAKKSYCPTELGGMMGYLTAVEEYLAKADGVAFDVATVMHAAAALEPAVFRIAAHQRSAGYAARFDQVPEDLIPRR